MAKRRASNEGGSSPPEFRGKTTMKLKNKTETCVMCGAETGYFKNEPIAQRKHFVAGCGQLCEKCYHRIEYEKTNQNIDLTPTELEILLEMIGKESGE